MKPLDLNIDDYHKAVEAFHGESDRAAAVLAGGFIESYLAKYLRSFMVADDSVTELFDGFGPFADFKQRYEAAYAFGFLSSTQRSDLKFVAKVRNHFAHHPLEASFDKAPVSDWCSHLSTKGIQCQVPGFQHTNRELYLLAVSMCVASWHNAMLKREKKA
ncbi:MAG: hypothetical protein KKC76_20460 [Proteobacteria bacterium]|nr:hypothetical protein [Pseudomonadota bacterium]MCG2747789.1 hypothetical protein [Desulfobulbaceae bacterium]